MENLLDKNEKDPDRLHDLFVKVSSDLAYASTFYPKRSVRAYLNQLTQRVFDSMEKKKTEWSIEPLKNFFRNVLPVEMYAARKALLASFLIFSLAVIIGAVSTAHDSSFPRIILGDRYVDMTEKNISNNDPMAVYKDSEQSDMFLNITVNNIRVSFLCFIMGIFGSLGTIIILFHNGIMLGAFQYYFHTKGLFLESFLTIWIHGTIEISAIIIAGAAGIVLGNGLLFPSTYNRGASVQVAAKRAVRILMGTVPLFVIAGFLESFVTRLTEMPTFLKVMIILLSLIFILALYVVYPWWHNRHSEDAAKSAEILPNETETLEFEKVKFRNLNQNIYLGFAQFRLNMGKFFSAAIAPLMGFGVGALFFYQLLLSPHNAYDDIDTILASLEYGGWFMFFVYWIIVSISGLLLGMMYREQNITVQNTLVQIKMHFVNTMLITLIPTAVLYFTSFYFLFLFFLFVPPAFFAYSIYMLEEKGWSIWSELGKYYNLSLSSWAHTFVLFLMVALFQVLLAASIYGVIGSFFLDFISWHTIFEGLNVTHVVLMTSIYLLITLFLLPLYFYLFVNQMNSESAKKNASDLWSRFESFKMKSKSRTIS